MRDIEYLSPTSIAQWYEDRSEFYLQRLADERPPRLPQTRPMAAGAAFDAFIKSYLVENLFGEKRPKFELKTLFEEQVEPHNRDWAKLAGGHIFTQYKKLGAIADLMLELSHATHEPRFEFTVTDDVAIRGGAVPLLGKPDVYFITKGGEHVVYDWKVNGYCGKSPTSPKPGYIIVRGGRTSGKAHKDCQTINKGGIDVNVATTLEVIDESWASQISIYAWILGEEVGSQFIAGIDQIVAAPNNTDFPDLRVASHRCRVGKQFQIDLEIRIYEIWEAIKSGHIFDNLSREESDARCLMLDNYYKAFPTSDDPKDKWFQQITREHER